jgi:hypothetical protein
MHCVVGIRNSHDKAFAAGIIAGAQVLVCDNLCFSGEILLARKHTGHIHYDLPVMVTILSIAYLAPSQSFFKGTPIPV